MKLTQGFRYTREELVALEKDFQAFLLEYSGNRFAARKILRELAHLEAFYLHDLDTAIVILEDLLKVPSLEAEFIAECKIDLGDFYLMKGDVWESTLFYSQVDKMMKDAPLGEVARFKNARLSYYKGEFLWAQAQLDILKASTSELIANDALQLSVFITDNLGLDTVSLPMEMFARAGLLSFQNRDDEALKVLDSINVAFSTHSLTDDMLMMKAEIALKKFNYVETVSFLEEIAAKHGSGILADDALYKLGTIYEIHLKDAVKAMSFYEKILLEHKGSIFVIDARKRYRQLRGDI